MSLPKKVVVVKNIVSGRNGALALAVVDADTVVKGIVKDLNGRFGKSVPVSRVKLLFGDGFDFVVTNGGVAVVDVAVALGRARMAALQSAS